MPLPVVPRLNHREKKGLVQNKMVRKKKNSFNKESRMKKKVMFWEEHILHL